jgi:hypothetical protein
MHGRPLATYTNVRVIPFPPSNALGIRRDALIAFWTSAAFTFAVVIQIVDRRGAVPAPRR